MVRPWNRAFLHRSAPLVPAERRKRRRDPHARPHRARASTGRPWRKALLARLGSALRSSFRPRVHPAELEHTVVADAQHLPGGRVSAGPRGLYRKDAIWVGCGDNEVVLTRRERGLPLAT